MRIIEVDIRLTESSDFDRLEEKIKGTLPVELKDFLLKYEGAFVSETYYLGKPTFKEVLVVYKDEEVASIESIIEGHQELGIEGFIPFAIDSGGWDYCVSINPHTYGQVWVDKFDSGEEDPMEFVANSFEEFINGLGPEPED